MCDVAKRISPKSTIYPGNVFDFDFSSGTFDVITMMSLICQLPISDARILLEKIKVWLKPKTGCIYISTSVEKDEESGIFTKETLGFSKLKGKIIKRFRTNYTIDGFIKLIEDSGFDILMPFLVKDNKDDSARIFQGYICRARS
jgi:2-polyprenyl-3-methyl-5-hydroxy-6-metoxy-1,4-benzoquinol methylase